MIVLARLVLITWTPSFLIKLHLIFLILIFPLLSDQSGQDLFSNWGGETWKMRAETVQCHSPRTSRDVGWRSVQSLASLLTNQHSQPPLKSGQGRAVPNIWSHLTSNYKISSKLPGYQDKRKYFLFIKISTFLLVSLPIRCHSIPQREEKLLRHLFCKY